MKIPDALTGAIRQAQSVLLVAHVSPDGDALGSSLALARALRGMGKSVSILDKDAVPRIYRFLPGWEAVSAELPDVSGGEPDALVLLDCGELERTGFKSLPGRVKLVVDHHLTERSYGDVRWVLPTVSSTGEMVYNLIRALGAEIDAKTALCLYTAIFTDTGGFRYSSSTPSSFRAAADLVELGVKPWSITENVYESISPARMRLMGMAINGIRFHDDVAVIVVTHDMYRETGTTDEDTENFANLARSIQGVEVAVFIRQTGPESFKVSMRSKGRVNVAAIAETIRGGGHHNAAGGKMDGTLAEVEERIVVALKNARRDSQS
ncbi:MAG: bifunctional oligoribonuclease/PAP phosphatase NrnA [Nitrospirae bacterium]|nr:bifunctional oligoribonuclease/PAP phosphatase NrnA [Nitrospirota bacterium]